MIILVFLIFPILVQILWLFYAGYVIKYRTIKKIRDQLSKHNYIILSIKSTGDIPSACENILRSNFYHFTGGMPNPFEKYKEIEYKDRDKNIKKCYALAQSNILLLTDISICYPDKN